MPITIYGKENCAPCKTAKYLLDKKKLRYSELPMEEHLGSLVKLGFTSAPVIKAGDRYFGNIPSLVGYLKNEGVIM